MVSSGQRRLVGFLFAGALVWVAWAAPAAADTASFAQGKCSTWTVPNGVTTIGIVAVGGAGAGTGGGKGGEVSGTLAVAHGQVLEGCVGVGGGPAGSGSNPGGMGGVASGVSLGATGFASPVIVAAGGGGAGGGGGVSGGNAGLPGSGSPPGTGGGSSGGAGGTAGSGGCSDFVASSSSSNPCAGQPGSAGVGGGGGGGGGAGYDGGSGGGGALVGSGGGGGGGADFCSPSVGACNAQAAQTNSSPQVVLYYAVASPPSASITTPANGAGYRLGQQVSSNFTCADGAGGPGVSSCTDQSGNSSGAAIDTSTAGSHTFTVTAASSDGLSSSSTVTYTVASSSAAPPRIYMPLPANGGTYTVGQVVHSFFQCGDGAGGPGLRSCLDQNGQPSGAQIDTSTAGAHTYTVTATSQDGLTSSVSATYNVVPPPAVSQIHAHRGGTVTLQVTVNGPGGIYVMNTANFSSFSLAADIARRHARAADIKRRRARAAAVQPPLGSFVFGSALATATGAQTLSIRVGLSQAGKLLLRDHRGASITVWVLYTGPGGTPSLIKTQPLRISR